MTIVLVTGGFDPLHSGHIAYFEAAKKLGDQLVVGINSDAWLVRKKGRTFMPLKERVTIVKNLKNVDWVMDFNDEDDTANHAISKLIASTSIGSKIIFANGGDRTEKNIPAKDVIGQTFEGIGSVVKDERKDLTDKADPIREHDCIWCMACVSVCPPQAIIVDQSNVEKHDNAAKSL